MKALQYIEIDLPHCGLTYSIAPCQATLTGSPPTGTKKCFNTPATCQDRANYSEIGATIRFAVPTDYLPNTIDAIPNIKDISFSPGLISLGKNLGQRSALTITFTDHRHSDTGAGGDPYLADRAYDPWSHGTFLARFRARNKFLSGKNLRWINGELGQALADMETRHYIIDSYEGPSNTGEYTITAKDILRLADGDKSLAPRANTAFLAADITNSATSLTLLPAGVGDSEFATSGYVAIGGNEIAGYSHQKGFVGDSPGGGPNTVLFDGTNDYLTRGAGMSGAADSKLITISGWIRRQNLSTTIPIICGNSSVGGGSGTAVSRLQIGSGGGLNFMGFNAALSGIVNIGSTLVLAQGVWYNFLFSIDLTSTAKRWLYINDVSHLETITSYVNDTIDFTLAEHSIGAFADGGSKLFADVAELWVAPGVYIDFSVTANRRLFITSDFRPVPLGATGQLPTGSTPLVYLGNPAASYATNLGTGGGFTLHGTFTTSALNDGDTLQNLTRGQLGTVANSHTANDRVQVVLQYISQDPAVIISDLLTNYALIPSSFISLIDWQTETATYLAQVYSGIIASPTAVADLVSELIEQGGLVLWWDDATQKIGLAVVRGSVSGTQEYNIDNTLADSLEIKDQPDKRLSQAHIYFSQISPFGSLTDPQNFKARSISTATQAESDYGSAAIHEIFSRWINAKPIADKLGTLLLQRYQEPPRHFKFQQLRDASAIPSLARTYNLGGWPLQTDEGAAELAQVQITRVKPMADIIEIEGDELLFTATDTTIRNVTFDVGALNVNARTAHDSIYTPPSSGNTVNLTINTGVIIGSSSNSTPAFDIGTWPAGVTVTLTVNGRIEGAGGRGDDFNGNIAGAGGPALKTRQAITMTDAAGQIWGGGGGGGSSIAGSIAVGGSGGAGQLPGIGGSGSSPGNPGTTEAGGVGFIGLGNGGGPALAGSNGNLTNGAAGGISIDGISFVTTSGSAGDRRGGQVN